MNSCVHYHTWIYVRYFCCRCHCLSRVLSPNMSPNFAKQQQKQQQPTPFPQSHQIKEKNPTLSYIELIEFSTLYIPRTNRQLL